jgi:hypothetical protein
LINTKQENTTGMAQIWKNDNATKEITIFQGVVFSLGSSQI